MPDVTRLGMFDGVCGYNGGAVAILDVDGVPSQAVVGFVSGQCFEVAGVLPSLGRLLTNNDAPLVTGGSTTSKAVATRAGRTTSCSPPWCAAEYENARNHLADF